MIKDILEKKDDSKSLINLEELQKEVEKFKKTKYAIFKPINLEKRLDDDKGNITINAEIGNEKIIKILLNKKNENYEIIEVIEASNLLSLQNPKQKIF